MEQWLLKRMDRILGCNLATGEVEIDLWDDVVISITHSSNNKSLSLLLLLDIENESCVN